MLSHRSRATEEDLWIARFMTRGHARFFRTGRAFDESHLSGNRTTALARASRALPTRHAGVPVRMNEISRVNELLRRRIKAVCESSCVDQD
jgi:hypothetical protein